jgi:hypothetical protein
LIGAGPLVADSVTLVKDGEPEAFARLMALGVPRAGVDKVGDDERTTLPLPVVDADDAEVNCPCAFTLKLASE